MGSINMQSAFVVSHHHYYCCCNHVYHGRCENCLGLLSLIFVDITVCVHLVFTVVSANVDSINTKVVCCAEAAAAAAVIPPKAAALPGGSAVQRENFQKAQQKQREGAIWRQTAACICDHLALYWRQEAPEPSSRISPTSPGQCMAAS